jgi:hypothetical protein
VIIISIFVLEGVLEKLLSRVIVAWQVVRPEEALVLGVVSLSCRKDIMTLSFLESKMIIK